MRELVFPLPLNDSTAAVRRDERLGIELWPQGLKWWALQLCMGIKDMKKKTETVFCFFFFLFVAKENNEITIRNDNIVGSKVIWSASLLIFFILVTNMVDSPLNNKMTSTLTLSNELNWIIQQQQPKKDLDLLSNRLRHRPKKKLYIHIVMIIIIHYTQPTENTQLDYGTTKQTNRGGKVLWFFFCVVSLFPFFGFIT